MKFEKRKYTALDSHPFFLSFSLSPNRGSQEKQLICNCIFESLMQQYMKGTFSISSEGNAQKFISKNENN
jgi:hypothetical protein